MKNVVMPRKIIAKNNRMILTDSEPTLCPAFSKKRALNVQQTATRRAANSPMCDCIYKIIKSEVRNLKSEVQNLFNKVGLKVD